MTLKTRMYQVIFWEHQLSNQNLIITKIEFNLYYKAMDLSKKKCKPCEGGIAPLNEKEIAEFRKFISGDWNVIDINKLTKEFFFVSYRQTIDFINRVADIAEEEGHHPVLHIYFGRVVIELWTHSINGLSDNDFILASKIDKL
ncbi:MAG: 4a-hydroxytetrahydrobiopterin dehydratase [Bacteroidales bacterium]